MVNRAAVNTILGYFYQFDCSISKILQLNNLNDSITIEGIEDIDIKTIKNEETTIQCKYHEKTEYNHSVIAKPIRFMLTHFKEAKDGNKPMVKYILYGYYRKGHEKLKLPLTVQYLKENFLKYTKDNIPYNHAENLGLTDNELEEFLLQLEIDINAVDYKSQLKRILSTLQSIYNCSEFQAENFYYNNALNIIKELSVQKEQENRRITKKQFLDKLDNKKDLFNEWFILYKGRKALNKSLREEYFSDLNTSPFERFFLIEVDDIDYSRSNLKEILFLISKKYSKISIREPKPFCPYILMYNLEDNELLELKKELFKEDFKFSDGYDFLGASFSPKTICQSPSHSNPIKLKIINNRQDLSQILIENQKTKFIYQFYKKNPFFEIDNIEIKHIKIKYDTIRDIKEII
ncbi:DUF4297 family anti-phage-associated protein [Bacillus subtilis]